jgi:hypothetical protein
MLKRALPKNHNASVAAAATSFGAGDYQNAGVGFNETPEEGLQGTVGHPVRERESMVEITIEV